MNVQIGNIVGEIVCGNSFLTDESTLEDFMDWIEDTMEDIQSGIFSLSDYPNIRTYANDPEQYWPHVEKYLMS